MLPDALAALARWPQFVPFKTWPNPQRPGKTIKAVTHPDTGRVHDAHDRAIWGPYDPSRMGFVLSDDDPFFLLDIDDALQPDGTWSQTAVDLCRRFAGCAVEVSQSGRGLHIIGSARSIPEHGTDSKLLGSQLFTTRRFVALTGLQATGDAGHDATEALAALIEEHFPPVSGGAAEWHEGPVPEWRGPRDDDDLIRRALRSTSIRAVFGGAASFADLWHNNAEVLAKHFPGEREPIDESAVDAALASHLAFWTGCDMPRIERLMRRSALVRDKWEREDYLPRTIARFAGPGRDVCRDKEPAPPTRAEDAAPEPDARPPRGSLLDGPGMADLFRGCVYVKAEHAVLTPGGEMLPPGPFNVEFGGYSFLMKESTEGAGAIKSEAFQALTQSARFECARVAVSIFDPRLPFAAVTERHGLRAVNVYRPLPGSRAAGDPSIFLDHLALMLPVEEDRRILLSWMAACVQHPGVKFQWWPIIQGCEGNGKTLLADIVAFCIGETYATQVRVKDLTNNFNAWMRGALFVLIDDIGPRGLTGETLDLVKPMVTRRSYPIERKGHDTVVEDVFFNGMGTTNYKDAVPIEEGTRRFAPFFTAQQSREHLRRDGMTPAYLDRLWRWLNEDGGMAVVHDYLASYEIPAELNPAKGCVHAPPTSSVLEAIEASKDTAADTLDELLGSGQPGLRGGWVNANALRVALGRDMPTVAALTDQLARRGYVPHPALAANRGLTRDPLADGKKGRLYITRGHRTESWTSGVEVAKAYEADQVPGGFGAKPDHVAAVS